MEAPLILDKKNKTVRHYDDRTETDLSNISYIL